MANKYDHPHAASDGVVTTEEARQATGHRKNYRVLVNSLILTLLAALVLGALYYSMIQPA